jgi:hypothetical protein
VRRSGCRDQAGTCNPLPRRFESVGNAISAGQFFVNLTERTVSYAPLPGEGLSGTSTFTAIGTRSDAGRRLVVGAAGLTNVSFVGLAFEHSGQYTPTDSPLGFVDIQAGWYQSTPNKTSKYW